MVEVLLAIIAVSLVGWGVTAVVMAREVYQAESDATRWRSMMLDAWNREPTNPHARLLGKVVNAKKYEGSEFEPMVVVAVSHKGALAVRPVGDPRQSARWIPKGKVERMVRERV